MTNTSNFDDRLLNDKVLVNDTRRSTSFDLILFKVLLVVIVGMRGLVMIT